MGIGSYHMMALSISGYVYTWGHNQVGQLGYDINNKTINNKLNEPVSISPCIVQDIKDLYIKSISVLAS